jgi:uncharacterized protein YajQ (UPF0234 family)
MPSFDVVSKVDWSEIANALDQARREVGQRFDFKGTETTFEQVDQAITIVANADDRVNAALDVLKEKLIRRKVSLRYLEIGDLAPARMGHAKRVVTVKEGISQENAKVIVKLVKDSKMKVQAAIHEDAVRISGKKRDDLQSAMAALRANEGLQIELQFINFRE